jgi:error-prone DNA polymerase
MCSYAGPMGWNNPNVPWRVIERALSDRHAPRAPGSRGSGLHGREDPVPEGANGGDSPAWSPQRPPYVPPPAGQIARRANVTPYAELHCHSSFSFLDGASQPEQLAEEGARAGLQALAITDHDGFYGVVRFSEAADAIGLPTVFGSELSLGLTKPQAGEADPEGSHLLVLARDPEGYGRLAATISEGQLAGREKGKPDYSGVDWSAVHGGHWLVLTGCRKGAVPGALLREGPAAAARELDRLIGWFGRANVAVELWDHGDPLDSARNDALAGMAAKAGVAVVATNNVHYAVPAQQRLATALAAVRARRNLDDMVGWLPPAATAYLRSGDEQARRFARWPGAVEQAAELGRTCAFNLSLVAPQLPPFECPRDLDEMGYLRELVYERAGGRYGSREAERVPGAWDQLDHELEVIEALGFPGYFLIVWDIVEFCRRNDILCQGRGSAANSAVCYVLGITNADAVSLGLLFERFLSTERDGPPDIDIDIESDQREDVIQYVYRKHGRWHAAQVANVITYRSRSAVRDAAKALGYSPGQQDAWSRQVDPWGAMSKVVSSSDHELPAPVVGLAREIEHLPRHLGIHSGGMVICDRPIVRVCPVEWARMEGRTVLQWDKDDCAVVGLVKFDLLGLGMLSALHYCLDLVRKAHGVEVDLAGLPQDEEIYDMLCRADSIGVFQVESRAQMATLPRLRPRKFYDLVVEVAIIRPGPIQGGSVHPYIRRRKHLEEVTYLHPALQPALNKTLGVPLFQEQLMQIAMDVAGFSPAEADQLRQAMGSKRSRERMEDLRQRFYDGMAEQELEGEMADMVWQKLVAFAAFGFPESHAVSFAYLVYASSWLKRYYPAAFCAALLNAQPMGFYSPHTLVQDARRHGVEVRTPDLNVSSAKATLEPRPSPSPRPPRPSPRNFGRSGRKASVSAEISDGAAAAAAAAVAEGPASARAAAVAAGAAKGAPPGEWGRGGPAVRIGLGSVREVGDPLAERLVEERTRGGPYRDPQDLVRRVPGLTLHQLEALATAGAMGCFGLERREAIWVAGAVAGAGTDRLDGILCGVEAPRLPGMEPDEEARADLWATGISPEGHPTRFVRETLDRLGVVPADRLGEVANGRRVTVGGVVTHRQRPATAGGTMFVNLEDETGLVNVVVSKGCWTHYRRVVQEAPALVVRGRLERADDVTNVIAQQIEALPVTAPARSRDFR